MTSAQNKLSNRQYRAYRMLILFVAGLLWRTKWLNSVPVMQCWKDVWTLLGSMYMYTSPARIWGRKAKTGIASLLQNSNWFVTNVGIIFWGRVIFTFLSLRFSYLRKLVCIHRYLPILSAFGFRIISTAVHLYSVHAVHDIHSKFSFVSFNPFYVIFSTRIWQPDNEWSMSFYDTIS